MTKESLRCAVFMMTLLTFAACSRDEANETKLTPNVAVETPTTAANASQLNMANASSSNSESRRAANRPRIVAFGDSLTAGYGLAESQSYPALLQERLDREGYNYEVVNAGVSGDTTAGGLRRLDWVLKQSNKAGKVEIVILELGANDLLRGQPIDQMRRNLAEMIKKIQASGARVLLAGMEPPEGFGAEARIVRDAFRSLAGEYDVRYIPFFLQGVAGQRGLNLDDGAHPNAEGTKIVAANVYQALQPMLEAKDEG